MSKNADNECREESALRLLQLHTVSRAYTYNNALMSWWEKFLQLIPSFDQPSPRRAIDRLRPPGRHVSLKLD